jgi:hypothetical protein
MPTGVGATIAHGEKSVTFTPGCVSPNLPLRLGEGERANVRSVE